MWTAQQYLQYYILFGDIQNILLLENKLLFHNYLCKNDPSPIYSFTKYVQKDITQDDYQLHTLVKCKEIRICILQQKEMLPPSCHVFWIQFCAPIS